MPSDGRRSDRTSAIVDNNELDRHAPLSFIDLALSVGPPAGVEV